MQIREDDTRARAERSQTQTAKADSASAEFLPPEGRSICARLVTWMVREGVKWWPREDPGKLARRARRLGELPNVIGFIVSRGLRIERVQAGSVRGEWISARKEPGDGVLLYLHGGGYISCSAKSHRSITASLARRLPGRVFSLDYRLAPEHPCPAAIDDSVAAYSWLLRQGIPGAKIALAGDSAGGGLAIATLTRIRALGFPMPACALCFSPWVDLTANCDYTNRATSFFQANHLAALAGLYLQGQAAENSEASPVFADLTGLPPLLIYASQTELLVDDAVRLNARAQSSGVQSTLMLYPDLPHVWQIWASLLPEARLALDQSASFIAVAWKKLRLPTISNRTFAV